MPIALAATAALIITIVLVVRLPVSFRKSSAADEATASLSTVNAEAHDRYLRATGLLNAGGRENALRAEQLLREALKLDAEFHSARETLVIALLSIATFVPERASRD